MLKAVQPASFRFSEPLSELVKVGSRGLRGEDRRAFVKRASHSFLEDLHRLRPGEVPVHQLAVGAHEAYGSNRNGDTFKRAACRRFHDTFVKLGHYFYDHKNKPTDLRYGRIIKSAFNEDMQRIELLLGLFATKEAAARAGELGRVAERSLQKLARGDDLCGSMACRVAYDVCSHCGNHAPSRDEYCDVVERTSRSGRVIPPCSGFGARRGLTKVADDGSVQYVDNPEPHFFDFSDVHKNADRIAVALGVLEKAAGAESVSGAELAERFGLEAPRSIYLLDSRRGSKTACQLHDLERLVRREAWPDDNPLDLAVAVKSASAFDPPCVLAEAPHQAGPALRALADACVCLPPREWLHLTMGKAAADEFGDDLAAGVRGVFGRMQADPRVEDDLAVNPYVVDMSSPPSGVWAEWAGKIAASRGLDAASADRRIKLAVVRGVVVQRPRTAAASPPVEKLARHYAMYQLGFLGARPDSDSDAFDLTSALLVRLHCVA